MATMSYDIIFTRNFAYYIFLVIEKLKKNKASKNKKEMLKKKASNRPFMVSNIIINKF